MKRQMKKHMDLFLELGKVRISMLATISMITGYILAYGNVSVSLIFLVAGVFLLACGSATVNHLQDQSVDSRMQRTRGRPLPAGRVTRRYAWVVAVVSVCVGCALILAAGNATAALLGLAAIFWYNAVYTPLKRVTAFAAVPGGIVGAIPPVIGWTAGGGAVLDPRILAVAFFFFVWQVPHFWLLLLFTAGKDYERAGMPSLTRIFGLDQLARITFMWIFATAVTCLVIPLFGIILHAWVNIGLLGAGLWLVVRTAKILRRPASAISFRLAFRQINLYVCWVISLLAANGIVG
ncbi:MAG: protoheme IX farnesyltransferase [Candidatus Krumholzibacteriia bacterium]